MHNTKHPSYRDIARAMLFKHEELVNELISNISPLSEDQSLISEIHKNITELYPELDRSDTSILLVGTVYKVYSPIAFFIREAPRAPNGIRKVLCNLMGWQDAPVVNYYMGMAKVYMSRPFFKHRVKTIMESVGITNYKQW